MPTLRTHDLTKSYRATAALVGCDHHTVKRYVSARAAGLDPTSAIERPKIADAFIDKIAEWIERSCGRVRADVMHRKLVAMGYPGSERTTRRVVAVLKREHVRTSHRVYRPWIPEPGAVAAVGLRPWPGGGWLACCAVLRVAGVVPVPVRAVRC